MSTALLLSIYSALSIVVHVLGGLNAVHAVMNVRSSRAAVAWSISLATFPWLTIPLYWILGKSKFQGYTELMRSGYQQHSDLVKEAYGEIIQYKAQLPARFVDLELLADKFEPLPFTTHNGVELLVDGEKTYPSMLAAIAQSTRYILLQSYIIHSDEIGDRFQQALIKKAQRGVKVYLIYDSLGSNKLPRRYIEALKSAGVEVSSFRSSRGKSARFQLNFRNHRKILIVDGKTAFVGGLNIGDEYLGKDPKLGDWRDTHVKVQGPTVQTLQRTLLGDWYWATQEIPEVAWQVTPDTARDQTAFTLSTGPADALQDCALFFLNLINKSDRRLWIASPYFVPDNSTLNALKLAAIRGVDVRIILPARPDQWLVYACSFSYYEALQQVGIKVYRYQPGFMHQKVILCDDAIAGVGTINLDNRSFFLNFEVMAFVINPVDERKDTGFIRDVEDMFEQDFERSRLVDLSKYQTKPFWFKLAARTSRLLAPIL